MTAKLIPADRTKIEDDRVLIDKLFISSS